MKKGISKTPFFGLLPYIIIIIIGVGLSVFLFFTIRLREKTTFEHEFRRIAKNRVLNLERLIHYKFGILESVCRFFESSQLVEPKEFESFISSFSDFEGFYGIAWVPCVKDDQRKQFEERAEAAGLKGFSINERNKQGSPISTRKRKEYFPVYYIQPFEKNRAALGFDLASEPSRYVALTDARDNHRVVATESIRLILDNREINSVVVFMPLYKKGVPINTVQQRRENLEGFIAGAFHIDALAECAMSFTDVQDINIHLLDLSASADKRHLCCYPPEESQSLDMTKAITTGRWSSTIYAESTIDVGTRKWSVICIPKKELFNLYITSTSWTVLAIGLLLTLSALIYYRFTRKRTEAIQRLVGIRTQELARLTKRLEAKNAELKSVVYVTSHDLRTPLVTISGFSRELQKSCDELRSFLNGISLDEQKKSAIDSLFDDPIAESLRFIHAGVKKAEMLINGLLQVSRVGTSPFNIQHIDMNQMIESIVESQSFQAKECGAQISVDRLPDCFGDGPKTNQVFSNLITNALKYLSSKRPGKIHISAARQDDRIIYCVADNGVGIPPEDQSRVFEVFHRVDSDESVKVSGDGLGLAIVSRILDCQNGAIWLESEVGKGSKFYVSLPMA